MQNKAFNINQDEIIKFTKRLDKLHKSDLPLAIRSTLNDTAFEAKRIIPIIFDKNFTVRKKTFIKSHTSASRSKNTFNVNQMYSSVGIIMGKSEAGNELEKQERGGVIRDRDFIPLDSARISKSEKKLVSKRNYLKSQKNRARKVKNKESFEKAAFKLGKGGSIIFDGLLIRVTSVSKGGIIKSTALYDFKKNRSVKIDKKPFVFPSSIIAQKKTPELYKKNAEFRIRKALKR